MLDDLKLLHERDTLDSLGKAGHQAEQLAYAFDDANSWSASDIHNVVIIGDGYAALAGLIAKAWLSFGVPLEVVGVGSVPGYVGEHTLCIATGDVEVGVRSNKVVRLESGLQLWQCLKALATIFDSCGLTQGRAVELAGQQQWLANQLDLWSSQKATSHNLAKQIALELMGRTVVIYGGDTLASAARKWQVDINANAKQLAWLGDDVAFGYAGFAAWTKQPVNKLYAVVELRPKVGMEAAAKPSLFEAGSRLLSGLKPAPVIIEVQGDTILQQLLYAGALSDYVSAYLAILNGVSPAESPIIAKLTKELS